MTIKIEFVLSLLAAVGIGGFAAIVKIFADLKAIKKAQLEIDQLRSALQDREARIVLPTSAEIDRYRRVFRSPRLREDRTA